MKNKRDKENNNSSYTLKINDLMDNGSIWYNTDNDSFQIISPFTVDHSYSTTSSPQWTITTTSSSATNITSDNNTIFSDPYVELEKIEEEKEREEQMRRENPSLQEAWDHYQLIKKLVEEEEVDKYFEDRCKNFRK